MSVIGMRVMYSVLFLFCVLNVLCSGSRRRGRISINIGTINIDLTSYSGKRMDKLSSQIRQVKESVEKLSEKVDRYHPHLTTGRPPGPSTTPPPPPPTTTTTTTRTTTTTTTTTATTRAATTTTRKLTTARTRLPTRAKTTRTRTATRPVTTSSKPTATASVATTTTTAATTVTLRPPATTTAKKKTTTKSTPTTTPPLTGRFVTTKLTTVNTEGTSTKRASKPTVTEERGSTTAQSPVTTKASSPTTKRAKVTGTTSTTTTTQTPSAKTTARTLITTAEFRTGQAKSTKEVGTRTPKTKSPLTSALKTTTDATSSRPTTPPSFWIFYPRGTTEHRVKRTYPGYELRFVGFGEANNFTESCDHRASSFEDCTRICFNMRTENGSVWNAVTYKYILEPHFKRCSCRQEARGFLPFDGYLHYVFSQTSHPWIFYPPETKEHRVRRFYEDNDLIYVGFGNAVNCSLSSEHRASSFDDCVEICVEVRKNDGEVWNSITFKFGLESHFKRCVCQQEARGFLPVDGYLHYEFQ